MRHRLHALCPYFAMFPESFAATWIERLTSMGQYVLDPFCGRGTAPFQALLMGRRAVASDVNPVAYCVTRAKTNAPSAASARRRLSMLEAAFRPEEWEPRRRALPEFFHEAYRPGALRQILFLRDHLKWRRSDTDCMLAALVLGALHGETDKSDSYLSNQMPRTISTKPDYSVRFWRRHRSIAPERNAFALLRSVVSYRYESEPPARNALVVHTDMRELSRLGSTLPKTIRCVITSPPYFDVTSYEEDQWLRLWFLGGAPRPTYHKVSRDDRYEVKDKYWGFIADFWRMLGRVLAPRSDVVVRLGGRGMRPDGMAQTLLACSAVAQRRVRLVSQEASEIQRRQTESFRPGSSGCRVEVDCHFAVA